MRNIIIFMAGAGVGSALTYFYVKDKYAELAKEEINAMKEYYDGKVEKLAEENKSLAKKVTPVEAEDEKKPPLGSVEEYKDYLDKSKKYTSYESVPLSDKVEVPTLNKFVPDPGSDFSPEEDDVQIYEIPKKLYDMDDTYSKQTVTYYTEDKALTTEADEIMDCYNTLGDCTDNFEENPDKDVLYIRNEFDRVDYEVVRDPRSFKRDILGEEEDDE